MAKLQLCDTEKLDQDLYDVCSQVRRIKYGSTEIGDVGHDMSFPSGLLSELRSYDAQIVKAYICLEHGWEGGAYGNRLHLPIIHSVDKSLPLNQGVYLGMQWVWDNILNHATVICAEVAGYSYGNDVVLEQSDNIVRFRHTNNRYEYPCYYVASSEVHFYIPDEFEVVIPLSLSSTDSENAIGSGSDFSSGSSVSYSKEKVYPLRELLIHPGIY